MGTGEDYYCGRDSNTSDATGKLILGTRLILDKGVEGGWNYGDDLVIDGSGKVGIGTTTPDAMLAVKGTTHTQEVKVDMNGWADNVFKLTYRLPSLPDVKSHLDKNKQLPEMPSDRKVVKDDINLEKMVKLQTKN